MIEIREVRTKRQLRQFVNYERGVNQGQGVSHEQ